MMASCCATVLMCGSSAVYVRQMSCESFRELKRPVSK